MWVGKNKKMEKNRNFSIPSKMISYALKGLGKGIKVILSLNFRKKNIKI